MRKTMTICLMALACVLSVSAQGIYDINVKDNARNDVSLADYKGKVLLIVNTATRCGFTPQYNELEALYEKYRDQGLEILDFPCNQFGAQAPGTNEEIHQFCTLNYKIKFPQFDKIDVNGDNESPLFSFLKQQRGFGGFDLDDPTGKMMDEMLRKRDPDYDKNADIKWNFTKFLVSRDGRVVKRYEPTDKLSDIEADIRIEMNPMLSTIMSRTSIREYTNQTIAEADIETLLRAGMAAPTAVNRQPWHFVAVTDKAKLKELSNGRGNMLEQCALAIVVCGNMEKALQGKAQEYWIQDCSAATENILLAAHAMGLGAVWTGVYPIDERVAAVSKAVKLPETIIPLCVIVIGYPAESPAPKNKWKPENVSYDEYRNQ